MQHLLSIALQEVQKHRVLVLGAFVLATLFVAFAPDAMVLAQDTFGLGNVETGLNGSLGNRNLIETAASIINVALGLLGIVAVVIILVGGFRWMTAGGNEDKVAEARKTIFAGIIGLAIILSAWAIARFVITQLSDATNSGDVPTG